LSLRAIVNNQSGELVMAKREDAKLIVVDWMSTPNHSKFNDAFFAATALKNFEFASFSPTLSESRSPNSIIWSEKGRLRRLARVLGYCIKKRKSEFLFLTYDGLFLPFITVFCGNVMVFEHNTTPEPIGFSKHLFWQKLTFMRVLRLAQTRQQHRRLIDMKQECIYLGSPIKREVRGRRCLKSGSILIGSRNFTLAEANLLSKRFRQPPLLARKMTEFDTPLLDHWDDFDITVSDWLEEDEIQRNVKAIYVNLDTKVRGSGWFNDAISLNIPLILLSPNVKELFKENFTYHNYFDLQSSQDPEKVCKTLSLTIEKYETDLVAHNDAIKRRFNDILNCNTCLLE